MFDPNNQVVQLCAAGMEQEGHCPAEAHRLFVQAWELAGSPLEKLTAAHYLARQQPTAADKLRWDLLALQLAGQVAAAEAAAVYPSLYLNVAKGYEDLGDLSQAASFYQQAQAAVLLLPAGGYGQLIRGGIENGLRRLGVHSSLH